MAVISSLQTGVPLYLDTAILFLNESNKIEDQYLIDYNDLNNRFAGIGHWGAFLLSQASAKAKEPLTAKMLCKWQKLIIREELCVPKEDDLDDEPFPVDGIGNMRGLACRRNVTVGEYHPPDWQFVADLINQLILEINFQVACLESTPRASDADKILLIADSLQKFQAIHPFLDGNGRVGRLLANYISTRINVPLIVFRRSEREEFFAAHKSKLAMRCFIAKKYMESIFFKNEIWFLVPSGSHFKSSYANQSGEFVNVDWYKLKNQIAIWSEGSR